MAIPKVIYQTYKTEQLPLIFKWHISRLKKNNPDYDYQFYNDEKIASFIETEFGSDIFKLYNRINIGAAKADFFRYAILYKKGGVYLDIDSRILNKIDSFVFEKDAAVISNESNGEYFIQFALFFEANHPFLEKTIELLISNLKNNSYPFDTHKMTGPTVYSKAIKQCMETNPEIPHRILGIDYEQNIQFSFPGSKTFLYGFSRKNHWRKIGKSTPVIS